MLQWKTAGRIRRFLLVRSALFLLILGCIGAGFGVAVKRLEAQQRQIFFDANSTARAQTFEAQSLEATRYVALQQPPQARQAWEQARSSLLDLRASATSEAELLLWNRVSADFARLQRAPREDGALEQLLRDTKEHQRLNVAQMEATRRAGETLRRAVDAGALFLLLGATALVVSGEVVVWRRIFGPTVEIARAAEAIRAGNLEARARIAMFGAAAPGAAEKSRSGHEKLGGDELGQLAATFNAMAGALQDRERGRLDFVAQVAHDLKNPLTFIGGAANLLGRRDDGFTPEERHEWLGKIEKYTKKLESLVGEMTDAAQSETGRLHLHLTRFDASALSHELLEIWRENAPSHHFEAQIAPGVELLGDRARLERVVGNLLSNAVKYSPPGRTISLTLEAAPNQCQWSVRDEGDGLSAPEIASLFVPFSRLERTQKMASGSGLGLSAVKKIVEAHGGQIEVRSQPGQGATFLVQLPRTDG